MAPRDHKTSLEKAKKQKRKRKSAQSLHLKSILLNSLEKACWLVKPRRTLC